MIRVLPAQTIREWDQYTIEHEPILSIDLMERAATQCTNWLSSTWNTNYSFSILCGHGNNGGDGLAIARQLLSRGYKVKVYATSAFKRSSDNELNFRELNFILPTCIHELRNCSSIPITDIIIDALLGTGISKPLTGELAACINEVNQMNNIKVSIDIPSGLHADEIMENEVVFDADYTLSFQCVKKSFLFPETGKFCGQLVILDIGLHQAFPAQGVFNYQILDKKYIQTLHCYRKPFSHKGNYGHSLLIAGSHGKMGACILAARACLRSGTGLLSLSIPESENQILQSSVPEAMTLSYSQSESLPKLENFYAIGIGCGLGTSESAYRLVKDVLNESTIPLVLDADALNIISNKQEWLSQIPKESVLTPHPKEFDRLFGPSATSYERFEKQIDCAKKLGIYILLKGRFTSIVSPDGDVYFNVNGNPGMATGGSGDVLTGLIVGLFAQYQSMKIAVHMGCFLHGYAGDMAKHEKTEMSLIASDLIEKLPDAIKQLFYTYSE